MLKPQEASDFHTDYPTTHIVNDAPAPSALRGGSLAMAAKTAYQPLVKSKITKNNNSTFSISNFQHFQNEKTNKIFPKQQHIEISPFQTPTIQKQHFIFYFSKRVFHNLIF